MRHAAFNLLLLALCGNVPLMADEPVDQSIEFLLKYTASSQRTFIRNGQEYGAEKAVQLMRHKYEANKKDIHSPEDFIRLAATKSSTTGLPYQVKLADGKTIACAQWLGEALAAHRADLQKSAK